MRIKPLLFTAGIILASYGEPELAIATSQSEYSFALVESVLSQPNSQISVLRFSSPCFICREGAIGINDVLALGTMQDIAPEAAQEVKKILKDRRNYILELSKPCPPINPQAGLMISSNYKRVLLLLFPDCKSMRPITDDSSDHAILNMDPASEKLLGILNDKGGEKCEH